MRNAKIYWVTVGLVLAVFGPAAIAAAASGPVELRVDNLKAPLGIDDPAPAFSWQLQDHAPGARQTAYELLVASSAALLQAGRADVWDSGRIPSAQSLNIRYAGPALAASMRYYWRLRLWDAVGNPYPDSDISQWETGLLSQSAWHAKWIGYETQEEAAVRNASAVWIESPGEISPSSQKSTELHSAYRAEIQLGKPIRHAFLYATGQDTVSAWVNSARVMTALKLPPWMQMPWKKFVRVEVTSSLHPGSNELAVETVHYGVDPNGMATENRPPMIATLVVENTDGSWQTFASNPTWKTASQPANGWQQGDFDDSKWNSAVTFASKNGSAATPLAPPWIPDSVKALRHTFRAASIKSARLYATALGAYEIFLNGKRVGDEVLAPGWTDYRQTVKYQTYDVTAQLLNGENAIAALLAPGWYETPLEWFQQPNNYGLTPPALRAQLRIEQTDGAVEWINTGSDWRADPSYIGHSEIYDGETQDARMIQPGWNTAGFNAHQWHPVAVIHPAPVAIEAQDYPPIRVETTVAAKSMAQPRPGVYVYDFGQNLSGVPRLRVSGPRGTQVQLRFAEILNSDGTIYTDNLRTALATDRFVLNGGSAEEFIPQFTFLGFRYVELTGLPAEPAKGAVAALVIHTGAPFTATLHTGSALINQLWSNILWGQRSNFVGIPTDCPQRDERLGWMADAQVFWRTAAYNMDLAPFSRQFAQDMRGTQTGTPYYGVYSPGTVQQSSGSGAGWSDAGIIIPWTSWLQTGDTRVIDQNWAAMEKYLNAIQAANPDGLWKNEGGTHFGDWLSPEGKTSYTLIATAYWAYDVSLMQQMAHATNRTQDETKYAQLFEKIRTAFQHTFIRSDGFVAGADNNESSFGVINNPGAKASGGDTQTGYVLALHMNLLPASLRAAAAQRLVDKIEANHGLLGTGFLGTPYLLEELTKTGHAGLAYKLLLNTNYPSWGYMVEHGATTMWERWNGDQMLNEPSMNSFNHYAYGAVADWIYRYAAGVDATPLDAGFHTVLLHPVFDARLGSVAFDYQSAYGPIHSEWKLEGDTANWNAIIPANTTAWLPLTAAEAASYKLDGVPLASNARVKSREQSGQMGYELPSGSYTFQVMVHPAPR